MQRLAAVGLLDAATLGWPCSSDGMNKERNQSLEYKNDGIIFCKLYFVKGHCEDVRMSKVWCGSY
jgi:hypothetical protein